MTYWIASSSAEMLWVAAMVKVTPVSDHRETQPDEVRHDLPDEFTALDQLVIEVTIRPLAHRGQGLTGLRQWLKRHSSFCSIHGPQVRRADDSATQ